MAPALIFPCLPSRAVLRIRGRAPHAALFQQIMDAMPAGWKTGRVLVVQELTDSEMEAFAARIDAQRRDDTIVDGCYQRGGEAKNTAGTIRLCAGLEQAQAELVFTHEYGHFIWDEKLTAAQRAAYKRVWRRQKRTRRLVTPYAGEDVEEGFAETLAYFLRRPDTLRQRDPESSKFLSNLLKTPKNEADHKQTGH